jgi:hypothetical protein
MSDEFVFLYQLDKTMLESKTKIFSVISFQIRQSVVKDDIIAVLTSDTRFIVRMERGRPARLRIQSLQIAN